MRFRNYLRLDEKRIIVSGSQGKKYGNIIILAGGAASGKGFATENFLEGDLFKIRDIDAIKNALLKIAELKNKYPEIRGLDLTNPKHVFQLHKFVAGKKIKGRTLNLLLNDLKKGRLPNILFDITFQHMNKVKDILPKLKDVGYKPEDVNIVWVLTNYKIAVAQNREPERGRIVPDDILLQAHEGAAMNMHDLITKGTKILPKNLFNGEINVILNNREETIFWTDSKGNIIKTKPSKEAYKKIYGKEPPEDFLKPKPVIKDFKYLKVKKKGQPITDNKKIMDQIYQWIIKNIPKTDQTKHIWKD
jgi:hypothetical protein